MASACTPRCIVPGCDGFFMTSQPGPYYLLRSRDHDLLVDWLRACKYSEQDVERQISEASNNDVICASHFIGRKFRADVANQRVPSVFPWSQCGTSEENSREMEITEVAETVVVRPVKESAEPRQIIAVASKPQDIPQRASNLSDTARRLSDLIATKRALLMDDSPTQTSSKKAKVSTTPAAERPLVPAQATKQQGRCIVPECDGYFRGENTVPNFKPKYYTLPVKDDQLLQEWLLAIGLTPKSDLSVGKICCTHFKDGIFNSADPLHRMPIVFAPRKHSAGIPAAPAVAEEPKKSGLKPNMKPHFARKPVPEPAESSKPGPASSKVAKKQVAKPQPQKHDDEESYSESSSSDDETSESSSDGSSESSSDSSSSLEMVSAMPQLHSAAVTVSMKGPKLSVVTPEQLCTMIMNNHATIGCCEETENEPWRGLVDCDLPAAKSFGFGKFLFSLGLNIVRRRVYKTALAASARQEKRKKGGIVLSNSTKAALNSALENFDGELAINRLDNFIEASKLGKEQCIRCTFTTESRLVLDWHRRQPHFDRTKHGYVFCCLCPADQPSMKITVYREHLRYSHGCSFVIFDLFSQPYQCHYCTVCCASWKILLSHMNNCRLIFNMSENLRPDLKNDTTLAVNLTRPPQQMAIDRQLHAENAIYHALFDAAVKIGLRQKTILDEPTSSNFVDLSGHFGLPPVKDVKALAPLGFDDSNQEFASFFGYLRPQTDPLTRTTILQVPQSTAIVQIVHSAAPAPPTAPAPAPTFQSRLSWQPPKPMQPAAAATRYSFAPPSELPSSFRPIRVAKLPEITMATIAAATAASRPPQPPPSAPSTSGAYPKPANASVMEPLNSAPPIREAPTSTVVKRPEPPFTGTNSLMPLAKRFRQTEFCLTTMQRLLFCELCRGIVQEREALRIHLFWAHRIGLPPAAMLTDEWYTASCPSCGVGFYTPDGIEQHRALGCYNDVFVPTFCIVCHKFLSTSSLLCAHLAREHGLTPPSMTRARVCFICSSAFDTEEHCADHLRLGHQMTTEPNAEREDFINVIWQGQLVASVDPEAIGAEAAAAMLSLQAAAAFANQSEDGSMLVEKMDEGGPAGGLGAIGEHVGGISSANRALFFAARGGVAAPFRRGPGRPPLRGPGRSRGSRARGHYHPRATRGPYRPRGSRLPGARGPGRPPLTTAGSSKRTSAKRHAPRDESAAGKVQWFHEEFSLSETDDEDNYDTGMMLEPDEPDMDAYDEGGYGGEEYYDDDDEDYSPRARASRKHKYY